MEGEREIRIQQFSDHFQSYRTNVLATLQKTNTIRLHSKLADQNKQSEL